MSYVAVLPFAYRPYFDACMETIKLESNRLLVIDNTVNNIGIMKSHNLGVEKMRAMGADWLIIISAAIRFGEPGGLDFAATLEERKGYYVIHAATPNVPGGPKHVPGQDDHNGVFGWHLTAFHREVFDNIGVWDENFTPYGLDDIDLSIRIQKHYKGRPGWDTLPCDVSDTTMGHSISMAGVVSPYEPRQRYFISKWGRDPAAWREPAYDHPFNNPDNPLSYWPTPPPYVPEFKVSK